MRGDKECYQGAAEHARKCLLRADGYGKVRGETFVRLREEDIPPVRGLEGDLTSPVPSATTAKRRGMRGVARQSPGRKETRAGQWNGTKKRLREEQALTSPEVGWLATLGGLRRSNVAKWNGPSSGA